MKLSLVVQLTVEDTEFLLSTKNGNLTIADGIQGTVLATYSMATVPLDEVARDIPKRIIDFIVRPHLLLETDQDLLKFYLLLMNIINTFYIHETTTKEIDNDHPSN